MTSVTDALREQIATAKMTADEAARWKLEQQGATSTQLAAVKALQDQRQAIEDQQKAEAELAKTRDAMRDEARQLVESLKSPEQKQAEQMARYRELLHAGMIDLQTYTAAIEAMRETAEEPIRPRVVTNQVQGAAKGTAEAMDRIEQARRNMADLAGQRGLPTPRNDVPQSVPSVPRIPADGRPTVAGVPITPKAAGDGAATSDPWAVHFKYQERIATAMERLATQGVLLIEEA